MNIISEPGEWNSVHRPIEYTLGFYEVPELAILDDGGFVALLFNSSPLTKFVVGDYVYMDNASLGLAKITTVTSPTQITTDKPISSFTGGSSNVRAIVLPEIRIYKGYYSVFEAYPTELPFELVASFKAQMTLDFDVQIDISGYLKSIFRILPPTNGIDFNMFNQFRISRYYTAAQTLSGQDLELFTSAKKALNASVKTNELSLGFLGDTVRFGCGDTIVTVLTDSFAKNIFVADGDLTTYFSNDFNCDFIRREGCG